MAPKFSFPFLFIANCFLLGSAYSSYLTYTNMKNSETLTTDMGNYRKTNSIIQQQLQQADKKTDNKEIKE
jgi:hypothetical protein